MQCKRGIWVKKQQMTVPCGQCMSCRINKGRNWTSRILMEQASNWHYHACDTYFLTFTYREETLPKCLDDDGAPVANLEKKKFLQWLKDQQRQTVVQAGHYRYYAIGEYGEESGRPHYHAAIFPKHVRQVEALAAAWNKKAGFTSATPMLVSRARYLAGYAVKKLTAADDDRLRGGQTPEFRTSSREPALGSSFADKLVEDYTTRKWSKWIANAGDIPRTWSYGGKTWPIPQFILNRVRTDLGIPVLARDRLKHDNYHKFFPVQEAESDWEEAEAQDSYLATKRRHAFHRGEAPKV